MIESTTVNHAPGSLNPTNLGIPVHHAQLNLFPKNRSANSHYTKRGVFSYEHSPFGAPATTFATADFADFLRRRYFLYPNLLLPENPYYPDIEPPPHPIPVVILRLNPPILPHERRPLNPDHPVII